MLEPLFQLLRVFFIFIFFLAWCVLFLLWPSICTQWEWRRMERKKEKARALALKIPHVTECRIWQGYGCTCATHFGKKVNLGTTA